MYTHALMLYTALNDRMNYLFLSRATKKTFVMMFICISRVRIIPVCILILYLCIICHANATNEASKIELTEKNVPNTECKPLPFPYNTVQRWLIAENAMNGLCNQMFGIYSYIPVAMLWNTSLVIGDVYSRPSFDVEMAKFEGWNSLPFTEFFDYDYFSTVWSRRGVSMILLSQYNASCVPQQFTVRTVTRDPHFWPNKDAVINKMLQKSSISLPIAENTVIKFDDMYPKFTALYNFWKGGLSTKMLLLRIHRSLRPAAHLQRIIDAVLHTLPKEFVVAHIRLEADYLLHEGVLFEQGLEAAMRTVLAHPCLQGLGRGPGGELLEAPALYLASGLFNATSSSAEPSGAGRDRALTRAQVVLERLRTMGFRAIYTRESVLNSVIAHSPDSHKDSNATLVEAHRALVRSIRALVPEQAALVDLSVSRACSCFVSSHYRSSFSYMAQRTRQLDRGQVLRYPEINAANFGVSELFRQWGV